MRQIVFAFSFSLVSVAAMAQRRPRLPSHVAAEDSRPKRSTAMAATESAACATKRADTVTSGGTAFGGSASSDTERLMPAKKTEEPRTQRRPTIVWEGGGLMRVTRLTRAR